MKISHFLILGALLSVGQSFGQGNIILLNGQVKRFQSAGVKGEFLEYQPEGSNPGTLRKLDRFDVFSLVYDDVNQGEEIIYSPDTVAGSDPTVEEARDYILGEHYAKVVYRKPLNFASGVAIGLASGLMFDVFYGLAAPVVYPAILGQFTPKLKHNPYDKYKFDSKTYEFRMLQPSETPEPHEISEAFHAGYGRQARNMKIKHSLIGGGIGLAVGITTVLILTNN